MILAGEISQALQEARSTHKPIFLVPYTASAETNLNEYCMFLKPEITGLGGNFGTVVGAILERLAAFEQNPLAAVALDAGYLRNHSIMSEHYGVIDAVSRRGVQSMSEPAQQRLRELFSSDVDNGIAMLGGHQFLESFPFFTAEALAVFYDNLPNNKLAGGTHTVRAVIRGAPVLIFNGFYPEQVDRYVTPGAAIVAFVIRTSLPWIDIRTELTGVTNPLKAAPQSIRGTLWSNREALGLAEVNSGKNGVHVSAGPVEGMCEIARFMSDAEEGIRVLPEQTTFGRRLLEAGFATEQIAGLCANPGVDVSGKTVPVFDVTEELDASGAVEQMVRIGYR